mgnify:CR=1 FL=1
MKNEKKTIIAVVVLLLVIAATVGASYAYFVTTSKTSGNDKDLNIVTENLGDIKWEGTKVFESSGLLPGEIGIQTFTIDKNSATGKGIYEIDLKGMIDESFGSDVEISLYKSVDTTTNNVTIKEGSSTISGDTTKQYYKEDTLTINGTPVKVYGPKSLKNKNQIILEQVDFDNSTLAKTTYYLVYHYKNADYSQDAQQGKSFSGEISVKLILEKRKVPLSDYVADTASDTVVDDYGNTRYIGSNPNNYVSIDGDIWRIIGVMKDIDDGTGNKSDRVKLIRAGSIGGYSWDTSESSINSGWGVNEWSGADLMKLLNPGYESESVGGSLYWNSVSGTCYLSNNNGTIACDFTSTGIKDKLKSLISDAVWNTGTTTKNSQIASKWYTEERGTRNGKICSSGDYCNDDLERTTTWTGKVGLMYPSDYGYATSGGDTMDRTTCLNTNLSSWSSSSASDCKNNDWLFNSFHQWTLTPHAVSSGANYAFYVSSSGSINGYSAYGGHGTRPVVYLSHSVGVQSGDGSMGNPFILSGN